MDGLQYKAHKTDFHMMTFVCVCVFVTQWNLGLVYLCVLYSSTGTSENFLLIDVYCHL